MKRRAASSSPTPDSPPKKIKRDDSHGILRYFHRETHKYDESITQAIDPDSLKLCDASRTCSQAAVYGSIGDESISTTTMVIKMVNGNRICTQVGCKVRANYNLRGDLKGLLCVKHKTSDMINVTCKTCTYSGCDIQPSYNVRGTSKALFCAEHKAADMIDVKNRPCTHAGCDVKPMYAIRGSNKRAFCAKHKFEDMIYLGRTCIHPGCSIRPAYNNRSEKKGLFCAKHKTPEMINVVSRSCFHRGCDIRPMFNIRGATNGLFCAVHKSPGMVNVKSKICSHPGCNVRPTYNDRGKPGALFCVEHKAYDMINAVSRPCAHLGCDTRPSYNVFGVKKALFCIVHKTANMVDVRSKKCLYSGCKVSSSCNFKGRNQRIYCGAHKLNGMVFLDKVCTEKQCKVTSSYGVPGRKVTHCFAHRQDGEISHPKHLCNVGSCKEWALYGATIPERCEQHHIPNVDRNVVHHKCVSCGLVDLLNENQKCSTCNPCAVDYARLHKQKIVKYWIDSWIKEGKLPQYSSYDQITNDGACSKQRPDFAWELDDRVAFLEVDENQHETEPQQCRNTRMINISTNDFAGLPAFWTRYNPDTFKSNDGKNQIVKESIRKEWLLKSLQNRLVNASDEDRKLDIIGVSYLFYDGFDIRKSCPPVWLQASVYNI
jgi:hypothetical protein